MSSAVIREHKDSGVTWLGKLPENWRIGRIKDLFEIRKRISGELGYDVLSITQRGIRVRDINSNDGQLAMDYSKYQLVYPGDFAMNHMDLLTGWIDISKQAGVTSPDYRVFAARDATSINAKFFLYVFQMAYTCRQFYPFGQGSSQLGRWRLPTEAFNSFPVPVPPFSEQTAIASFLDNETAKIDALVEEQRRLIALLKEKRQAVISHAVTKGLNPNAPMKDAGIEWLGEVPEHWSVLKLKWLVTLKSGDAITSESIEEAGNYPVYGGNGLRGYSDTYTHEGFYALIGRQGALCGNINYAKGRFWASEHAIVVIPTGNLNSVWLGELLRSMNLNQYSVSAAQPGLSTDALGSLYVPLAPSEEQTAIARFVDHETTGLDALLVEAQRAIQILQERRTALISAAVTGKIDVRPSAQIIPFPDNRARVRGLIATEIIERMSSRKTFGRVKLQKLGYLAEVHAGVVELNGNYERKSAGPLDSDMVNEMEREASLICGVLIEQPSGVGTTVIYRTTRPKGHHSAELSNMLGLERSERLNRLIADLKDESTRSTEAIATLYAVWNDALIDGKSPSDDDIVYDFLNDWHPQKREKFKDLGELHNWLGWLRRHGLVPAGNGPKVHRSQLLI